MHAWESNGQVLLSEHGPQQRTMQNNRSISIANTAAVVPLNNSVVRTQKPQVHCPLDAHLGSDIARLVQQKQQQQQQQQTVSLPQEIGQWAVWRVTKVRSLGPLLFVSAVDEHANGRSSAMSEALWHVSIQQQPGCNHSCSSAASSGNADACFCCCAYTDFSVALASSTAAPSF